MHASSGMAEPAIASYRRMAIIRNPRSGSAPDLRALEDVVGAHLDLSRRSSAGADARILDTPEDPEFAPWLDRIAAESDILVAAGGDGTVSSVAVAAIRANKTLAVIPTGTMNHFAKDAGIPLELDRAAAVIANGQERIVDVGVVNGHVFINNVSFGNYPRMVDERQKLIDHGRSRRAAAIIAIARTWWDLRNLAVVLTIDHRDPIVRHTPFIVIGNGSYVLSGFALGRRDEISDGQLWLYVAPSTGRLGALSLPIRALIGTLERHERFESFGARKITAVFASRRVVAALDGEVRELESPLELAIRRHALKVLVPRR
jgi:diacylglycerol kinase family enzyme